VRKQSRVLLGVLLLLDIGAGLVGVQRRPKSSIGRENCEKIQPGMTEAEVEEILGLPDGNHTSGRVKIVPPPILVMGPLPPPWKDWIGDEGTIRVFFDEAGKVLATHFLEPLRLEESLLDTLCRRLGF
jgi:hypothetical protein